ncbi:MAG TPA: ArsA-related P-loop ATPase [Acidobacteriota bacterium]|nr:ArsA-related P-loop ATPase [Acidobacteriota bacterium]
MPVRIRIFLGTGGVGKTSVTAAVALKTALEGSRCLVLTIDPSLRLKTALKLDSSLQEQKVSLEGYTGRGELWAALLDVRTTLDRAVRLYGAPDQVEHVLQHPIYQILIASLAGMQELMAIERIDQAIQDGFENLFIDTAPSRHAFEFLDKPELFANLVSIPVVRFVGRTYKWFEKSPLSSLGRKTIELYQRVEQILGSTLVRQVLDFYSIFRSIAEGYADRAVRTAALFHDPRVTTFTVVTTPFKARNDGQYFWSELLKRKFTVDSMIVNRVWPEIQDGLQPGASPLAQDLLAWYRSVSTAHNQIWAGISRDFSNRIAALSALPELPKDVDGLRALHQIALNLGDHCLGTS